MGKVKIEKNNKKIYIVLFVLCAAIFATPSIIYIINNKTIYNFVNVWTYFLRKPITQNEKSLNAILFFTIFSLLFLLYMLIIKEHKSILKNTKKIFYFIIIVSILFVIIIPYTSTDVYSYIANGWSAAHYKENPYYISTGEINDNNEFSDPMFKKVANCWKYEKVVYGPFWTLICTILSGLSFGNIDIAITIFKLVNLIVHILNCLIIYKTTKRNIFVILYGLNPFILFEALSNVHNDIFIVLFILLAIYFVKEKRKLYIAVSFIAIATAIKYLAILILPFIVLYAIKDKTIKYRIKYCFFSGMLYLAIIVLLYMIYLKDLNVLAGLSIQQEKYNRSVFYLIYEIFMKNKIMISNVKNIAFVLFAVYYIVVVLKILFSKEIKWREVIKKYYIILMIFTFILITNFNPWYIMWLYPIVFYLNSERIKNILHLSYAGQIANFASFYLQSEAQILGVPYFAIMILMTVFLNYINNKAKIIVKNN